MKPRQLFIFHGVRSRSPDSVDFTGEKTQRNLALKASLGVEDWIISWYNETRGSKLAVKPNKTCAL